MRVGGHGAFRMPSHTGPPPGKPCAGAPFHRPPAPRGQAWAALLSGPSRVGRPRAQVLGPGSGTLPERPRGRGHLSARWSPPGVLSTDRGALRGSSWTVPPCATSATPSPGGAPAALTLGPCHRGHLPSALPRSQVSMSLSRPRPPLDPCCTGAEVPAPRPCPGLPGAGCSVVRARPPSWQLGTVRPVCLLGQACSSGRFWNIPDEAVMPGPEPLL